MSDTAILHRLDLSPADQPGEPREVTLPEPRPGKTGCAFISPSPRCACGTQLREVLGDLWCPTCNVYRVKEGA